MGQDGIWIIDPEARTVYASVNMAEILGTTPDEMIGQPSFTYVFQEDRESAQTLFETKTHVDNSRESSVISVFRN